MKHLNEPTDDSMALAIISASFSLGSSSDSLRAAFFLISKSVSRVLKRSVVVSVGVSLRWNSCSNSWVALIAFNASNLPCQTLPSKSIRLVAM